MDYEALKEQWSEVEDRDGVRLSWNVFPSTRMVSSLARKPAPSIASRRLAHRCLGSVSTRGAHRSFVHPLEGEARNSVTPI